MTDRPSKRRLYELYWGDGLAISEIKDRLDCSRRDVSGGLDAYGIPKRENGAPRTAWVFWMRPKRVVYEGYWGDGLTQRELGDRHGVSNVTVETRMRTHGIPAHAEGANIRWTADGIPIKYAWSTEKPSTADEEEGIPDDPDPSKYLADYEDFDKHRLYELYWGHGHSIAAVHARLDTDIATTTLQERFADLGIPTRSVSTTNQHRSWQPHHGVPPEYEWPADRDDEEDDYKKNLWRAPSTPAAGD